MDPGLLVSEEGWREARQAWPGFEISRSTFERYAAERGHVASPRWADLYLACACAQGNEAALAVMEREFKPAVLAVSARIGGSNADELWALLRERLFVAKPDRPPGITTYSGRGELRAWLRITATRAALEGSPQAMRETPTDDADLAVLIGSGQDPELTYLKRIYTAEFRQAFGAAFHQLEPRERNLLRYAFGAGLNVDSIGSLFGVHRSTAARWVSKAHEMLIDEVRKGLAARLSVTPEECSSILRLIESQAEISLEQYLQPSIG